MSSSNDLGLVAPVKEGMLSYKASDDKTGETTARGSSELGKDAFLQLLVCQMQNQDPLEPSTDTEFVSQLAQFSQLEQLQNLSGETEKSQAFSLVGKYVIFEVEDAAGKKSYPEGTVDLVKMSGGDVLLTVDGTDYNYEDLHSVVGDAYYVEQNIPKIAGSYDFTYNAKAPEDLQFKVDFGKNEYKAGEIAVVIGGQAIDSSYLTYRDDTVTIKKEALAGLENGEYAVSVVFNNSIYTTVNDKISIKVYNHEEPQQKEEIITENA